MKKIHAAELWKDLIRWKGWRTAAAFFQTGWRRTIRWKGWNTMFSLRLWALLLLSAACAAGLVLVFLRGLEQWPPAYALYVLSFYCLTALCVKIPAAIRWGKQWLARHPRLTALLGNEAWKFTTGLYVEQIVNFGYGIFKIAAGVIVGSAWIGADGIYNLVQSLIQLVQILRRRKPGTIAQQWRSYRVCGGLILLMHLTLTGIVFQMVNWNRAEEHAGVMIFATAAFVFYKIISRFADIARDRKHRHPIDSSVRMLDLSQAIFAVFSLQASMLQAFGDGAGWEHGLNAVSGCVVCLLVAAMGVYMIRRGTRELKKIQEKDHE